MNNLTLQSAALLGGGIGLGIAFLLHLPKVICALGGGAIGAYLFYKQTPNITIEHI